MREQRRREWQIEVSITEWVSTDEFFLLFYEGHSVRCSLTKK